MISSMTAFSRAEQNDNWGSLTWEVRSVNHRYLEPHFKVPDTLRRIEPRLRELLKTHAARGKFDCALRFTEGQQQRSNLQIDTTTLEAVMTAVGELNEHSAQWAELDPLQLLQWPGVLQDTSTESDQLASTACALFESALGELAEVRQREGAELSVFIQQRLISIDQQVLQLRQRMPDILSGQRQRLVNKLEELNADLDNPRLEQEMVFAAQKADVDEELDRLDTHVKEVRRILKKGGSCGRRLDFLMQELNREANTLSSKSLTADTTLAAVELKVLIEQMREQVQNIE